jgi:hypothetical protein
MEFESGTPSLKRLLAEAQRNLRLIHERKSKYVQETDIPLQLIKDEQRLEQEIEALQAQLVQEAAGAGFNEFRRSQEPHPSVERTQGMITADSARDEPGLPDADLSDPQRQLSQSLDDPGLDKPGRELPRSPVPWWRSRRVWVPVIVALIGLAGVTLPIVLTRCDGDGGFEYLVRVQAGDTGDYVAGARVTVEIGGKAPLDDIADTQGVARIRIPSSYAEQPGKLIVEASGYRRYEQNINLVTDALPDVVQLEPAPG